MAKYVFGIDLGTTYSCIAYVDETGRATVVNNSEGTNTTPSVVNFASPNQVVVGQVAKENAVIDPNNTISLVKTLMGKTDFAINYNGEDKSPEEVSAYILRKVTGDAAQLLNTEVKDVVITCPAYFGTPAPGLPTAVSAQGHAGSSDNRVGFPLCTPAGPAVPAARSGTPPAAGAAVPAPAGQTVQQFIHIAEMIIKRLAADAAPVRQLPHPDLLQGQIRQQFPEARLQLYFRPRPLYLCLPICVLHF